MGVNARGNALATNFALQPNCEVVYISDVDRRAQEKCIEAVHKNQDYKPEGIPDFRNTLDKKDMDFLVIAAPDHWHAPAAIMAAQAGKHVYLEKPASHKIGRATCRGRGRTTEYARARDRKETRKW